MMDLSLWAMTCPVIAVLADRVPGIAFGVPLILVAAVVFAATHHESPQAIGRASIERRKYSEASNQLRAATMTATAAHTSQSRFMSCPSLSAGVKPPAMAPVKAISAQKPSGPPLITSVKRPSSMAT